MSIISHLKKIGLNVEFFNLLHTSGKYNFHSKFFNIKIGLEEYQLHYVDENPKATEVILMVHGNPTWSYHFREFIRFFKKNYRVIAVDHLGCGLSSKPQVYPYVLENHIENLNQLIKSLDLKKITLLAHDWGGAIGMGAVELNVDRFDRIILANTAAFTGGKIPFRIGVCRKGFFATILNRSFNLFAIAATFMTTTKKLTSLDKKAYLYPYNSYANRIAIDSFVKDIPLHESDYSYKKLKAIEDFLPQWTKPVLLIWGEKDFCFKTDFLRRFQAYWPFHQTVVFKDAAHYVLEDEKEQCIKEIDQFIKS